MFSGIEGQEAFPGILPKNPYINFSISFTCIHSENTRSARCRPITEEYLFYSACSPYDRRKANPCFVNLKLSIMVRPTQRRPTQRGALHNLLI